MYPVSRACSPSDTPSDKRRKRARNHEVVRGAMVFTVDPQMACAESADLLATCPDGESWLLWWRNFQERAQLCERLEELEDAAAFVRSVGLELGGDVAMRDRIAARMFGVQRHVG